MRVLRCHHRMLLAFWGIFVLTAVILSGCAAREQDIPRAVYLGVDGYGEADFKNAEHFQHRFYTHDGEVSFRIAATKDYAVQNTLAEGYVYDLILRNGKVTAALPSTPRAAGPMTFSGGDDAPCSVAGKSIPAGTRFYDIERAPGGALVSEGDCREGEWAEVYGKSNETVVMVSGAGAYEAPVRGIPGKRTLKNFLATAMEPVGVTLYVYGGAWNWHDDGPGPQAVSIGTAQTWLDFFRAGDNRYTYKNGTDPERSYYPAGSFNEYYYAGVDCSGFVGWLVYNTMHTESGGKGYVQKAVRMARTLAEEHGYGVFKRERISFRPGDIFSMRGHVWVCLGVCGDGSLVIVHAAPSKSVSGHPGGGVQLSGLGKDKNCEAYQLAGEYMERYYSQWCERYVPAFFKFEDYTKMEGYDAGKFSWHPDGRGLSDPENYAVLSAREILEDLFDGVVTRR